MRCFGPCCLVDEEAEAGEGVHELRAGAPAVVVVSGGGVVAMAVVANDASAAADERGVLQELLCMICSRRA